MVHRLLWIAQVVLGISFVSVGLVHFVVPEGLPDQMAWMYDLSTTVHVLAGTAEILGGIGLVLPALTRIAPTLTVAAALGLTIVMLAAAAWHVPRGEFPQVGVTLTNAVLLGLIAYGRWRVRPIAGRVPA